MKGLQWQTTPISMEGDLQALEETAKVTQACYPRVTILTASVITCRATFSLLEARHELRWEAATSTSTVSV